MANKMLEEAAKEVELNPVLDTLNKKFRFNFG